MNLPLLCDFQSSSLRKALIHHGIRAGRAAPHVAALITDSVVRGKKLPLSVQVHCVFLSIDKDLVAATVWTTGRDELRQVVFMSLTQIQVQQPEGL